MLAVTEKILNSGPSFFSESAEKIFQKVERLLDLKDPQLYVNKDPDKSYDRVSLYEHDQVELVLCRWNPGDSSGMHFHPEQDCYFKALKGEVKERRPLSKKEHFLCAGEKGYICDEFGPHEIQNEGEALAYTLHIYKNKK